MGWTDKEVWEQMPDSLREALVAELERQQRHVAILEAEVARMREHTPALTERVTRRTWNVARPPSVNRPRAVAPSRLLSEINEEEGPSFSASRSSGDLGLDSPSAEEIMRVAR
jgi:hypothetical protein